ncbi:uncharacterized protein LOC122293478 [Carya illinoinensis]|uniref:uncharacterized protein LOC122293478 n=1 Tax=Carya illinoinensis TaxID=32201 RepID=UPI001C71E854|nr:uncharacterized protein LOC122293478 [Carya illinoinensis]
MEEESVDQNNQHVSRFLNFSDQNNPYRIEHGDNTAASLVADLLTTENYVTWSRAMRRALRAKNKIGFINGDIKRPAMVSWIHNSVSNSVRTSLVFVDDACAIWKELQDRLSQQNGPRIFQLKKSLASLSQGDDSVSIYFGKLKTIWDELALYEPMPECSCGQLKILMERYQRDCVIQFLMGLSDCYSNTRDQIMLIEPMPALNRVFSMTQQQEKQHQMISGTPSPDLMAMFTKGSFGNFKPTNRHERPYCTHCKMQGHTLDTCFKAGNAKTPVCSHCNMSGHVIDKCYKLHGYPPGHKMHNKGKGSSVFVAQSNIQVEVDQGEGGDDKMALIKGQYQQLLAFLQ